MNFFDLQYIDLEKGHSEYQIKLMNQNKNTKIKKS